MAAAHNVPPPQPHFSGVGKEPTRIAPPLAQMEQPPYIAVTRGMAPILIGTMTESAANKATAGVWPRLPLLCGEGGVLRPPWAASVLGQDQPQGAGIEGGNPLVHGD